MVLPCDEVNVLDYSITVGNDCDCDGIHLQNVAINGSHNATIVCNTCNRRIQYLNITVCNNIGCDTLTKGKYNVL